MKALALLALLTVGCGGGFIAFPDDGGPESKAPDSAPDSGGNEGGDEQVSDDAPDDTIDAGADAMTTDAMSEAASDAPVCLSASCATPPYTCCAGTFCNPNGYVCQACIAKNVFCTQDGECCSGTCHLNACQ